jgi:hypothetical protein
MLAVSRQLDSIGCGWLPLRLNMLSLGLSLSIRVPSCLMELWGIGEFWIIYLKCVIFWQSQTIGLVRLSSPRIRQAPERLTTSTVKYTKTSLKHRPRRLESVTSR